jgi:hypothetical protein
MGLRPGGVAPCTPPAHHLSVVAQEGSSLIPIANQNGVAHSSSTTPTLVLLGRKGRLALYHPGLMQYEDLRAAIEKPSHPKNRVATASMWDGSVEERSLTPGRSEAPLVWRLSDLPVVATPSLR